MHDNACRQALNIPLWHYSVFITATPTRKICMVYVLVISLILFVAIVMVKWLNKSQAGTLTRFVVYHNNAIKQGASRGEAYRAAIDSISHHQAIGGLSEDEKERLIEVFSLFPDPAHVQSILREALVRNDTAILGEPYISNLERAGRDKGLID